MTLKANELRIGNLLNYQTAKGDTLTAKIDWQDLKWLTEDPKGFNIVHLPIPLTEEWLLKFDAIKIGNEFIFDRFRLKYRSDYKFYYVTCRETNTYITKVEFVHEWQNVVFALNSQELTLKNNSNN